MSRAQPLAGSRNAALDVVSGVAILWMLIYHAFIRADLTRHPAYLAGLHAFYWFIAWFFFKAGLCFRPAAVAERRARLHAAFQRLIQPLLIGAVAGFALEALLNALGGGPGFFFYLAQSAYYVLKVGDWLGNLPLWFLADLFLLLVLALYLPDSRRFHAACALLAALTGWLLSRSVHHTLPLGLSSLPLGLAYFSLGRLMTGQLQGPLLPALRVCSPLLLAAGFLWPACIDIHTNRLLDGDYLPCLLMSALMLPTVLALGEKFALQPLAWVGRKSLYLLVLHWPLFSLIRFVAISAGLRAGELPLVMALLLCSLPLMLLAAALLPEDFLQAGREFRRLQPC